jgi:hypothetical protein
LGWEIVLLMVAVARGFIGFSSGRLSFGFRVLSLRVGVLVVTIMVSLLWKWVGLISPVLGYAVSLCGSGFGGCSGEGLYVQRRGRVCLRFCGSPPLKTCILLTT